MPASGTWSAVPGAGGVPGALEPHPSVVGRGMGTDIAPGTVLWLKGKPRSGFLAEQTIFSHVTCEPAPHSIDKKLL